ncbi:histidine kinase [Kitasatospora sp. NPDC085879]|uniref:sensor histidine kinase n=1 Tax=Kitasatospora sp. NPDC085879 TaxID=3154769 RepID=UPI0034142C21
MDTTGPTAPAARASTAVTARRRGVPSALLGRRAALRWVHLVLGGALLMPFWLLATVVVGVLLPGEGPRHSVVTDLLALAGALPVAAVTGLVPTVRALESAAARALCAGAAAAELSVTPSRSWAARRRTATWFTLHLFLGGVASGMSLAVPPAVVGLLFMPNGAWRRLWFGAHPPPAPLLALGLLVLLLGTNAAAGAVLARAARPLLGPTPAERIAAAEQRALDLARRNRLARELHDSVGHALSAVAIQASAAGRVLRSDPEFAAEAIAAIEAVAREAVGELDTVLGLLREDATAGPAPAAPDDPAGAAAGHGPGLDRLDALLRQTARAGAAVETRLGPGLGELPAALSREVYRITQEGLTNVLRHAGPVPARLRIVVDDGELELDLTNPPGAGRPTRAGGGRGLPGITERVTALGGRSSAGPDPAGGHWRLAVRIPLPADGPASPRHTAARAGQEAGA